MRREGSSELNPKVQRPHRDVVSGREGHRGDAVAVHERSIGGLQVPYRYPLRRPPDFGVTSRDPRIVHHHVDLGASSNDQGMVAHREGPTVAREEARLALAADELSLDFEGPGLQVVIDEHLDLDGTHEAVTLTDGVLADRLLQLRYKRFLKALETLRVIGADPHLDLVGGNRTLTGEATSQIDFAYDPGPDLDGLQCALEGA